MPAPTPADSPLPRKNHQPGPGANGLVGTLEKALEGGMTLRREDYLRLFVAYFRQSKTRQDQGYGLDEPMRPV